LIVCQERLARRQEQEDSLRLETNTRLLSLSVSTRYFHSCPVRLCHNWTLYWRPSHTYTCCKRGCRVEEVTQEGTIEDSRTQPPLLSLYIQLPHTWKLLQFSTNLPSILPSFYKAINLLNVTPIQRRWNFVQYRETINHQHTNTLQNNTGIPHILRGLKRLGIRDPETIYESRKTFRNQFLNLKLNSESMDNLGVTARILDKQPKLRKTKLKFRNTIHILKER